MTALPDWSVADGELVAQFEFSDFKTAFSFITMVALESECVDHHPTWTNAYKKVSFAFSTHSVGNKITDLDIQMAGFISATAQKCQHV